MRLEVDVATPTIRNVCVALGRPEVSVAEHLLHRPQVGSTFEQVRRERVTEKVRVNAPWLQSRAIGELAEDQERPCPRERTSSRVEEQLGSVAAVEVGAPEREVAANGLCGGPAERDEPLLSSLSEHAYDPVLECDAVLLEAHRLRHAEARAVQELDERAVA